MSPSIHQVNGLLEELRGFPRATLEGYSRNLSKAGMYGETRRGSGGATMPAVAQTLFAVMRGSPSAAAENAAEIGGLVFDDGDAIMEPVCKALLAALGWSDNITFTAAVVWLMERRCDETIGNFVLFDRGIKVTIDRYWTKASLSWHPPSSIVEKYIAAWRSAFPGAGQPDCRLDGTLTYPLVLNFASPLIYERKVSRRVDPDKNRAAGIKHRELVEQEQKLDRHGEEWVTERTLFALADLFKG